MVSVLDYASPAAPPSPHRLEKLSLNPLQPSHQTHETMTCHRCTDERWVCEVHRDRPSQGRFACPCGSAGMPCPDCNPMSKDKELTLAPFDKIAGWFVLYENGQPIWNGPEHVCKRMMVDADYRAEQLRSKQLKPGQ